MVRIGQEHWLPIPLGKLHPPGRIRLPDGICLRDLHLPPHQRRVPTFTMQRGHARERGQAERAELFDGLIKRVETEDEGS